MKRLLIIIFLFCCGVALSQTASITVIDANCTNSTGIVTINSVTGATPNYTLLEGATPIATNVSLPFTFSNVSVGTHTYDIIGTNSVTITFTAVVNSNTIAPNVFATGGGTVTCSNPAVAISATSNVSTCTYTWMPQNSNTPTTLAFSGGNFSLTITDPSNGCTKDTVVFVWQNTAVPSISATTNSSITCINTVVIATGSSTTSGVTYSWIPSGATTNTISATAPSIHTLIVTDPSNGCNSIQSVTINQIPAFSASASVLGHVKCNGASTGSIEVNTFGGSGIFSVSVIGTSSVNGIYTSMPDTVLGLSAGNNTVFILDTLSGCTQQLMVILNQPQALNLSLTLLSVPEICEGEPVSMTSFMSGGLRPYTYFWMPTGGTDSTLNTSGYTNTYTLVATDANSCVIMATKSLVVNPKPQTSMDNQPISICGPSLCVTFTLASAQNTTYVYNWEITDANGVATPIQVNEYNPTICFPQPGLYNVDLNVISTKGCATQSVFPQFIKLYPVVKANYAYQQPEGEYIFTDVLFQNTSVGAYTFSWYDENTLFSTKPDPSYIFYEPGQYLVSLIASNPACSDTLSKHIFVGEATFMHFPNSFTPNKDGINDVWKPVFYGDFQGGQYELTIFDRWGKKVYWTVIIDAGWDGTYKDKSCKEDVYVWEMKLNTRSVENKTVRGIITLSR